jgi:fatty acid desaturase
MIQENSLYGCVEWSDRKRPWRAVGMFAHMIAYVGTIMILPFWTHPSVLSALAAVVLQTANNFAPGSTLWHFLSNGLNYQIEHHLFPGLNHCHLSHISPVVQSTCEEYGVCYKSYATWSDTMQAALDWLDKLSLEPELEAQKSVGKIQ